MKPKAIKVPQKNRTLLSSITDWFHKKNEDFEYEVKNFVKSYDHKGVDKSFMKKASLK